MVQALVRFALVVGMICCNSSGFAGGAQFYHSAYTQPSQSYTSKTIQSLAPFNQLMVSGKVNVILKNSAQNSIEYLNDSNHLIHLTSKGNKLIISRILLPNLKNNADPTIVLNVNGLTKIVADGQALIQGQLNNAALNLTALGNSQIILSGMVNAQTIRATHNAYIKLHWVNSPNLVLTAKNNSLVQLAGVVGVLHASLNGTAQLRGQYLRAQQAIIQTNNNAYAGISTTQALRAFAFDNSNIFYFKYPQRSNEFSLDAGNILQVDWRN